MHFLIFYRLKVHIGEEITYANDSSINATSWNGGNFKFEGRRSIRFFVAL